MYKIHKLAAIILSTTLFLFANTSHADVLCWSKSKGLKFVAGKNACPKGFTAIDFYNLINAQVFLDQKNESGNDVNQNLVTLYRNDPIAHSFSFSNEKYGHCFDPYDGVVVNCSTDISLTKQYNSTFTQLVLSFWAVPEGGATGTMVDLGSLLEVNEKYKSLVPKGYSISESGWYTSLHKSASSQLSFAHVNGSQKTLIPVSESSTLFSSSTTNFPYYEIKKGHLYVLRRVNSDNTEVLVKILVLDVDSDKVTLRYSVIK